MLSSSHLQCLLYHNINGSQVFRSLLLYVSVHNNETFNTHINDNITTSISFPLLSLAFPYTVVVQLLSPLMCLSLLDYKAANSHNNFLFCMVISQHHTQAQAHPLSRSLIFLSLIEQTY